MAEFEQMQEAGKLAREEVVHLLESMTPEERMGAVKLVNWIRKWYISAGYKQLLSPKYDGLLVTLKE